MSHSFRSWATSKTPIAPTLALILSFGTAAGAAWLPPQTRQALFSHVQNAFSLVRRPPVRSVFAVGVVSPEAAVAAVDLPLLMPRARILTRSNAQVTGFTFTVNSTADTPDGKIGDGVCQTSSDNGAVCTLRAAIQEANAKGGGTIGFNIPGAGDKTITVGSTLPDLGNTLTIANGQTTALTVSGNNTVQIFHTAPGANIKLQKLILSGGKAAGSTFDTVRGGAIYNDNAILSLSDCTLSGNTAQASGGAIYGDGRADESDVTLLRCTLSGNSVPNGAGGAIYNGGGSGGSADMGLTQCVMSNNSASTGGAAVNDGDNMRFTECSLLNNSATTSGGAVANSSFSTEPFLRFVRSTLAGNSAVFGGGALENRGENAQRDANITIITSTLSGNKVSSANGVGGAISNVANAGLAEITISDSTFAGNSATQGASISNFGVDADRKRALVSLQSSLFQRGTGSANFFNNSTTGGTNSEKGAINTAGYNLCDDSNNFLIQSSDRQNRDPKLGPLADNGGPTQTHALLAGSAAIDMGFASSSTDQRGVARPLGAGDIGAYEVGSLTPTKINTSVTLASSLNPSTGGQGVTFTATVAAASGTLKPDGTVTFKNGTATLGVGNLANGIATFFTTFLPVGTISITATYAGTSNFEGSTSAPLSQVVNDPGACSTVVSNLSDSGNGSLRAAIDCANSNLNASTITFASNVTGTIGLNTALPVLATPITVTGPDASTLTVQRSTATNTPQFGIFKVSNNTQTGPTVNISRLTIANGSANSSPNTRGGGILNDHGTLTVTDCVLSGNSALSGGGGIYNDAADGGTARLMVTGCVLSGNSTGFLGGGIYNNAENGGTASATLLNSTLTNNSGSSGGGIANYKTSGGSADATITNSTLSGNTASNTGGAVNNFSNGSTTTISNSTIINNRAAATGGGIYTGNVTAGGTPQVTLFNSTLSGNAANGLSGNGGGLYNESSDVVVLNCTFVQNSATIRGGGVYNYAGNFAVGNTIFQDGTGGSFGRGNFAISNKSLGYNLFNDSPLLSTASTDKTNTDAKLGPLADNGGPTQTFALLAASPAIDAGNTNLTTDQRGTARPQGAADDIGAFEAGVTTPTATATPAATPAATAIPTATATPTPTATAPPTATATPTPVPSACSIVVSNTNDAGDGSLRAAVDCANSTSGAQTVTFAANLKGTITLTTGQISVTDSVTIFGPGAGNISVSANGASRIFSIAGGLTTSMEGLTLSNGKTNGVQGDPTLGRGGAIYNAVGAAPAPGTLALVNMTLSNNQARNVAGFGSPGGAVFGGQVSLSGCTLTGNATDDEGGGVFGTSVTVSNSTLSGNTAKFAGGGVSSSQELSLSGVTIQGNSAFTGGGVSGRNATISNSSVLGNTAPGSGGGVRLLGTATLSGSTVSGNTSKTDGGGIYLLKPTTLSGSRVTGNRTTEGRGGGVFSDANVTLTNCSVSGNTSPVFGGGIYNTGATAATTIIGSTLSGNTTGSRGGGFYGALANFINSTVSGNTGGELSGGIYAERLALTNCSITNNTARKSGVTARAGGVFVVTEASIGNSIIAGNIADELADFSAFVDEINSRDFNLIGSTDFSFDQQSDRTGIDPKLGPLADNGGPTQTHALLTGSPAIDAGNPDAAGLPATDQRGTGFVRVSGGRVDIGAFETQSTTPVKINTSTTLTSSSNPSTTGQSVTFTATVTPASGNVKPGGTVTFKDGAATLGTGTLDVNGAATFTTSTLSAGTRAITTRYGGNSRFNSSTSAALQQVVNAAPSLPTLSISDVTVTEGNSGQKNATFSVSLSRAATAPVAVRFDTANSTATAGSDYTAVANRILTFTPGASLVQIVAVSVKGDTTREADETFFGNLSSPRGATVLDAQGLATIKNDDLVADLGVSQSVSVASVPQGGEVVFTITIKNNGPDSAQNVVLADVLPAGATFVSSVPTPVSQNGANLSFNLGQVASGATQTVTLRVRAPQNVGTFINNASVTGNGASDPALPNNAANGSLTVTNGAPAFTFSLGPLVNVGAYSPSLFHAGAHLVQTVTLTNSGTAPATPPLRLVLDGLPSSVSLLNKGGTATEGAPFVAVPLPAGTLSIGQSTKVRLEFRLKRSDKPRFSPRAVSGTNAP